MHVITMASRKIFVERGVKIFYYPVVSSFLCSIFFLLVSWLEEKTLLITTMSLLPLENNENVCFSVFSLFMNMSVERLEEPLFDNTLCTTYYTGLSLCIMFLVLAVLLCFLSVMMTWKYTRKLWRKRLFPILQALLPYLLPRIFRLPRLTPQMNTSKKDE